ncbi:MAG: hypothetical protein KJ061_06830 [Vicinamibacteraceae bacterium]|nr:hypothetical protein [Vicinamibacteraceae bacterium]
MSDLTSIAASTLASLTAAAVFILAVMIGITLWLDRSKLRSRRGRMAARSLDDVLSGERAEYLPPDAPRGPVDQLKPGTSPSIAS